MDETDGSISSLSVSVDSCSISEEGPTKKTNVPGGLENNYRQPTNTLSGPASGTNSMTSSTTGSGGSAEGPKEGLKYFLNNNYQQV